MNFAELLILILLVIFVFPYLVFLCKRIVMAFKLRRTCRREGYELHPAHPFWFWGRNNSSKIDCVLVHRDKKRVYPVKLYGSVHRLQNLYFIENTEWEQTVRIRRVIPVAGRFASFFSPQLTETATAFGGGINHIHESKPKKRNFPNYWEGHEHDFENRIFPILLFCPVPLNVMEARLVPLKHSTVERLSIGEKREDTTIKSQVRYDSELLHEKEYVFGTKGFLAELKYPHLGES